MRTAKLILHSMVVVAMVFYTLATALLAVPSTANAQTAGVPGTIGYNGRLFNASGTALSGTYYFWVDLESALTGGTNQASNIQAFADANGDGAVSAGETAITVTNGYFTFEIPIGTDIGDFNNNLWLEVKVHSADVVGSAETLSPRVKITKTPFAIVSQAIERSAADPTTGFEGRMYYDTDEDEIKFYDGTTSTWVTLASTLDDAYNNFGSAAQVITVDDASTGISFDVSAAGNFDIDLQNSGDFNVQDAGSTWAFFSDTQTFDVNGTGAISLDADTASNFNTSSGDLTFDAEAGSINIDGGEADTASVRINASHVAGGIDVDAGTGGIAVDSTGIVSIQGAAASDVTVSGSGISLTLAATGGGAQSVIINSAGTGSNAIDINATAGGIDMDAAASSAFTTSAGTLTLNTTAGGTSSSVILQSVDTSSDAILLDADGATGSGIYLDAYDVTNNAAGAITMDAGAYMQINTFGASGPGSAGFDLNVGSTGTIALSTTDGSISLNAGGSGTATMSAASGDVILDTTTSSRSITIGDSDFARTINIGEGTGADTMNFGTGSDTFNFTSSESTNDVIDIALASLTTADAIDIDTGALTTGDVFDITYTGTTGSAIRITDSTAADANSMISLNSTAADVTAQTYLIRGTYTDNGDAEADFLLFEDNNGTQQFLIGQDGDVAITGVADGTDALTVTTGDVFVSNGDFDGAGGDFNWILDSADDANFTKSAAAAATEEGLEIDFNAGAGNGSDIYTALKIDVASANHAASSDIVHGIGIDDLASADAEGVEIAVNIGTGWDAGLSLGSALWIADGTVGAPGLAFASDTDTGIYRIGANNLGVAVGGANVLDLSSQALTTTQTTFNLLNTTATTINFAGAATTVNLGAGGALGRAINLGTGTGIDTIAIGTGGTSADDINIGDALADVDIIGASDIVAGTGDPLIITANAASTWSTSAGALGIDAATALNLGNSTATSVSICNSANCDTLSLGTNADADSITIGDTGDTLVLVGGGAGSALTIDAASGGRISIDVAAPGTDTALASNFSVAAHNGGGSGNGQSLTIAVSGAEDDADDLTIQTTGTNGDLVLSSGDDFLLDAVGILEINSSGGAINIGNDAVAQNINIGTAGARAISIGAAATTSMTFLTDDNAANDIAIIGGVTFNSDSTHTLAGTENIAIASTTGSNAVDLMTITIANGDAGAAAQRGLVITNLDASTAATEALLTLDNADTATGMADGLVITSAAGGMTDAIDATDPEIDNALNIGVNDIEGTTGTITFTDFTVGSDGEISSLPDGNVVALSLNSEATTANMIDMTFENTQGTIVDLASDTVALTGALIGMNIDLDTGVTDALTAQAHRGIVIDMPDSNWTGDTGTGALSSGIVIDGDTVILNDSTGADATAAWNAYQATLPDITLTTGSSLVANGSSITTGGITTAGTQRGYHLQGAGVGAGTLIGFNISNITGGAGTEQAINIGNGWDSDINAVSSLEIAISSGLEIAISSSSTSPTTSDGNALGSGGNMWSDLFLADGGVVNFANGNYTLTHTFSPSGLATNENFTVGDDLAVEGIVDLGTQDALGTDTTPDVSGGSFFTEDAATVTAFDSDVAGQIWVIEHIGATVFDCDNSDGGNDELDCGAADITTATGDVTMWISEGSAATDRSRLISWMDESDAQTGADLAEWFPATEDVEAGDVLVASGTPIHVESSMSSYQRGLIGVVATQPGLILGEEGDSEFSALVALAGRVPVNVSDENGAIQIGDYLTSSATLPGYAMKATQTGPVIGMAMEGFSGGTGQITIKVDNMWYTPSTELQGGSSELVVVASDVTASDVEFSGSVTVAEHLYGSRDMAGRIRMASEETQVRVTFETPYEYTPIVTFSARSNSLDAREAWVSNEDETGFALNRPEATSDSQVEFNWIAVGVEDAQVTVSDLNGGFVQISINDENGPSAPAPVSVPEEEATPVEETTPAEEEVL